MARELSGTQANVLIFVLFLISSQLTYLIISYHANSSSSSSQPSSSQSIQPQFIQQQNSNISPPDSTKIDSPSTNNDILKSISLQKNLMQNSPYPYVAPLPSIRLTEEEESKAVKKRKKYGGKGDKLHLGGFIGYDRMGVSNNTWNFMMGPLGIKSILDLGCGRGISAKYFLDNGAKVLCIEGSHDAVTQSFLPPENIIEHDFTRGPWWPTETYDALWSVEFLEHVGRQYYKNYIHILHQAALIFVTSSNEGGWHHVEVREPWWWQGRFTAAGFIYSEDLTTRVRNAARATCHLALGLRIVNRMMVFINPRVASLPQHDHLFSGDGCIFETERNRPCDSRYNWINPIVDRVPSRYQSLLSCKFLPVGKNGKIEVTKTTPRSSSSSAPPSPSPLEATESSDNKMLGIWNCTKNRLAFEENWLL